MTILKFSKNNRYQCQNDNKCEWNWLEHLEEEKAENRIAKLLR